MIETTFLNTIGLRAFSKFKINDEDLSNFLGKFRHADIDKVREIKEYLGSKEDNDYQIKWDEIKRILFQNLKATLNYISKFNLNVMQNNLWNKEYSKQFYAIMNMKKVDKTEDVEYNPTIIINKTVSLVDLEKVKEENYKLLEETKFFAANDELLQKKVKEDKEDEQEGISE